MNFNIIPFESVTSTNDEAMEGFVAGRYKEGTIITAQEQTAGRGQRGNQWLSAPGENLTFSLVVEPCHIRADQQFRISETAALAASDAIRVCGIDCRIKWPNDLYIGERKTGGILIEHTLNSEYLSASIIGIGINIGQRRFAPGLPNPTSLALESYTSPSAQRHGETPGKPKCGTVPGPEIGPGALAPGDILASFCTAFGRRYGQEPAALHADYMEALWRIGGYHPYREPISGAIFTAAIEAIDPNTGELTLRTGLNARKKFWFKEIEAVI